MNDNASKGGSYVRQKDGSLKLVERTELAAAMPTAEREPVKPVKKEATDG